VTQWRLVTRWWRRQHSPASRNYDLRLLQLLLRRDIVDAERKDAAKEWKENAGDRCF